MEKERVNAWKIAAYCLLLLALYCLQTSRGTGRMIFGYRVDLLPCVVATVALLEGPGAGMGIGLLTGILYDLSLPGVEGLYPAYYFLFGLAAGLVAQRYLRRVYLSSLLLSAVALVVSGLAQILILFWMRGASPSALFITLGIELGLMAVFSPLAYVLVRLIHRKLS